MEWWESRGIVWSGDRMILPDNHPPHPRLWHCQPGSTVTLQGERTQRTILQFEGKHVRFTDGLLVTRCHLVRRDCMKFGDGAGWRPLINKNRE